MISNPGELFAIRLEKLINQSGITRKELANKLGFSITTIREYLTRGRNPNALSLYMLADYFGVSMDWLYGRTDDDGR